jgi:NAD(P)H dehydrogenase (quinone)
MKVGVSGASGQLGKAVMNRLTAHSDAPAVVGISRSPETVPGGVEGRRGDYDDPTTLASAYAGLDRLLIIPTIDIGWGARSRQLLAAIDAAVAADVGQIALMSDVSTRDEAEPAVGAASWAGEQQLIKTAPCWTILRANYYSESYAQEAELWLPQGTIEELGESRVALVSREDVAGAAAGILVGHNHVGAIYNATGPVALSGTERAEAIAQWAGKPLHFRTILLEQLRERYRAAGFPEEYLDIVIDTKKKAVTGGFDIVTGDVERLSGRAPLSFVDVLAQHMAPE